jgi:hypothetical protein
MPPACAGCAGLVAAPGTYSPEQRRRSAGSGRGAGGAVSGAATRIELKLANGDKLLVSQANSDGGMASSAPQTGQTVLASWSRSAMVPLEKEAEMTMVIPRAVRASVRLFWRKSLGLFLLLLGPLMWFGIVYLGSLLTLLWQSVYTFDDFTMSVTTDLTLANLQALFNPANYDIIVRTLVMALSVTMASAVLALPMWYMARYTRGKMKAFFYIAVMLPMWASYIVKAYAWTLLLAKDGVAQWFLGHLGLEGC